MGNTATINSPQNILAGQEDVDSILETYELPQALREKLAGNENPKIKTEQLEEVIAGRRPSITAAMLRTYDNFLDRYGERK